MQTVTAFHAKTLARLAKSIAASCARGNRLGNRRQQARIDQYEDIRNALLLSKEGIAQWEEYCKTNGYSTNHDAYDFFA